MRISKSKNKNLHISNILVEASYSMTLVQKRLLMLCIRNINNKVYFSEGIQVLDLEELDTKKIYTISVEDYANTYNIEYEAAKDEVELAINKLYAQEVIIKTQVMKDNVANIKTSKTRWFSTINTYNKSNHTVEFMWSEGIILLVSELCRHYTTYKMQYLSGLRSYYSIRLYEIFKMELDKRKKRHLLLSYRISELKNLLSIEDKYDIVHDFIKRVIEKQVEDINNSTDFTVSYMKNGKKDYIKEKKKVVGINFNVSYKQETV